MADRRVAPPPPGAEDVYTFLRFLDAYIRGDPPEYRERAQAYMNRLAEQAADFREAATLKHKAAEIDALHEKAEAWEAQARQAFSDREAAVTKGEADLAQRKREAETDITLAKQRDENDIRQRNEEMGHREVAATEREGEADRREAAIGKREAAAERAKAAGLAEVKRYKEYIARIEAAAALEPTE